MDDIRKLVTHWFPIEDAVRAFETSANPKSGSIKAQEDEWGERATQYQMAVSVSYYKLPGPQCSATLVETSLQIQAVQIDQLPAQLTA